MYLLLSQPRLRFEINSFNLEYIGLREKKNTMAR